MTQKTKNILWVVVPLAIAVIAFGVWYWLTRPQYVSNSNPGSLPTVAPTPPSQTFPLQNGTSNAMVKTLQQALGVSVDGIFGPQTQAALSSQFGMTSVPDQATLTTIVTQSKQQAALQAPAQAIVTQFQGGSFDIMCDTDTYPAQVTEDSSGNISPTGSSFAMNAGSTYDGTTFVINGVSSLGMVIFNVASGTLQGEYTVDPSAIHLIPHGGASNSASWMPQTNQQTGLTNLLPIAQQ
jgi:hypothetical protein